MVKNISYHQVGKWFVAELLGTFFFSAAVTVSLLATLTQYSGYSALFAPFAVGAAFFVCYYLFGQKESGGFNPAISVALYAFRKQRTTQLVVNLAAQLLGGFLGVLMATKFTGTQAELLPVDATNYMLLAEFLGTFLIVFAFFKVVAGHVSEQVSGLLLGLAYASAMVIGTVTYAGIFNPALILFYGIQDWHQSLVFFFAPLLGGLVAAATVHLMDYQKNS